MIGLSDERTNEVVQRAVPNAAAKRQLPSDSLHRRETKLVPAILKAPCSYYRPGEMGQVSS